MDVDVGRSAVMVFALGDLVVVGQAHAVLEVAERSLHFLQAGLIIVGVFHVHPMGDRSGGDHEAHMRLCLHGVEHLVEPIGHEDFKLLFDLVAEVVIAQANDDVIESSLAWHVAHGC